MLLKNNNSVHPSFLVAALIFSVFTLSGIVSAAWVDAPNAPPNYGTPGCSPKPCEEADFRPLNLSSTAQTKQGSIAASGFYDTQDPTQMYALDPASPIFSLNLAGHAVINATTTDVGAQLVVNNPRADLKVGSFGDAIYVFASSTDAAISAEQADPMGYAIYASGGINYFGGNVGIGTQTPTEKLDVQGNVVVSGNLGVGTVNPLINLALGDSDTGLKWLGDGRMAIYTNNTERLRIEADGKIIMPKGSNIYRTTDRANVVASDTVVGAGFFSQNGANCMTQAPVTSKTFTNVVTPSTFRVRMRNGFESHPSDSFRCRVMRNGSPIGYFGFDNGGTWPSNQVYNYSLSAGTNVITVDCQTKEYDFLPGAHSTCIYDPEGSENHPMYYVNCWNQGCYNTNFNTATIEIGATVTTYEEDLIVL